MGSPVSPLIVFNVATVAQLVPTDYMPLVGKRPPIKTHSKFGFPVFNIPDSYVAYFSKGETSVKPTNQTTTEYCEELDEPVIEFPDPNSMVTVSANIFTPMLPKLGLLKSGFKTTQVDPVASAVAQVSTVTVVTNGSLTGKILRIGYKQWTFSASSGAGLIQVGADADATATNIGAAVTSAGATYALCSPSVTDEVVTLTASTAGVPFDLVTDAGSALTLATSTQNATANTNYIVQTEWDDQFVPTDYGLILLGRRKAANQYGAAFCPRIYVKEADEQKLARRKIVERSLSLEGPLSAVRSDGQTLKFWKIEEFTINPTNQTAV